MWRRIGGVAAGYIVMFIFVMVTIILAYMLMGVDRAYKPGSYDVTATWIVVSLALSFLAAIIGGAVYMLIARRDRSALILGVFVIVIGFVMAIPAFTTQRPDPEPRTADVNAMEAMQNSCQPKWLIALNPLVGFAGVMLGGSLVAMRRAGAEPAAAHPE